MKLERSIIGALHLGPSAGYADAPGFDEISRMALADLQAFERGGVDAVIFENNYDLPHSEHISEANFEAMLDVGRQLVAHARIPIGVNVLWNDYGSALRLAKELNLAFIRVPVFVDDVRTSYGKFQAVGALVAERRRNLGADDVRIWADIHVKHATITSGHSITESAKLAIEAEADALILTGKWTGDAPDTGELTQVRRAVGDFPILIGSGADVTNINNLLKYANGAIVATSLKDGSVDNSKTNLTDWRQRINQSKVAKLTEVAK